jgi:hypothetical protein
MNLSSHKQIYAKCFLLRSNFHCHIKRIQVAFASIHGYMLVQLPPCSSYYALLVIQFLGKSNQRFLWHFYVCELELFLVNQWNTLNYIKSLLYLTLVDKKYCIKKIQNIINDPLSMKLPKKIIKKLNWTSMISFLG